MFALFACAGTIFAEVHSGTCGTNLNWTLDTGTGVLNITGKGDMNDYDTGYHPVPWKDYKSLITNVLLPDSLTRIGQFAFAGTYITTISIPSMVTSIGYEAFGACYNLTSIHIPSNVTTFEPWIFVLCSNLSSVTFDAGVTSIPACTFEGCTNLTSITLPNSVTEIGHAAFRNCTGLVSITLPNSITTMTGDIFWGCTGLTYVYISDLNAWFNIDFGKVSSNPLSYAHKLYLNGELITNLIIPNTISTIKQYSFQGCSSLETVTIPTSVSSIGIGAFGECSGLHAVYISDLAHWCGINFANYESNPVNCATNLYLNNTLVTDMSIPSGVQSIGNYAFRNAQCLTSVVVPESVTSLGQEAFRFCTNISSITWNAINCNLVEDGSYNHYHFEYCSNLTEFTLGEQVRVIPDYLCYNLTKINGIHIPNSVKEIGKYAFYSCGNMTSVKLGNQIEKIGTYAFYNCSKADSIVMPNTVTELGMYAFYGCSAMKYATISNQLTEIGQNTFCGCRSLENIIIPANIETIGQHAFDGCSGLMYITCEAVTPPACGSQTFNYVDKTIPLYVPAQSMETYGSTDQWQDFSDIRPIGDIYLVTFIDWDGTEIDAQYVEGGQAATAPEAPTREGYTFIGWDKAFDNVTEYMTVTAQYAINRFEVKFVDWNDTVLKMDSIDWKGSAVAPLDPIREGYTFIGWDKTFDNVIADVTIKAQYNINHYDVFFLDYMGNLLKAQNVEFKTAATAPPAPTREGYTFVGWSGDFEQVTDRVFAVAQYEPEAPVYTNTIAYEDKDGGIISTEGIYLTLPEAPQYDGFTFLGWITQLGNPMEGIVIRAIYHDDNDPTPVEQVTLKKEEPIKILHNGQIYILRGEKVYTLQGQEVK